MIALLLLGCGTSAPKPAVSTPVPVERVESIAQDARDALLRGDHPAALAAFDRAVALDSSIGLAVERAHALRIARKEKEAWLAYLDVIERDPDHVVAHLVLGEMARSAERWEAALPYLARAAELAPGSPIPWEHRAVCLHQLQRADEARDALARAEALGSTQMGVLRAGMQ
jgi:Flp pilus assembly protein TadD